jgi:diguanylate cyclase (GGDEF)-like protein/PAS domain S-box-containing protein
MKHTVTQRERPLILIVDDDPTIRLMAHASLEQAGFAVEEAENGVDALPAFMRMRPDIVLLDVMMPMMDGFEACEALRRTPEGLHNPILMMTGLDDIESINRAYRVGATDFITKPFNWVILGHRLHYIWRASQTFNDLRMSEARLANAQRIARIGNWEWDIERNELHWSEEMFNIFGVHPHAFGSTFESFLCFVHSDERESVASSIRGSLDTGTKNSIDHRIVLPDGSQRIVHTEAEVFCDDTGKAISMMGTVQDITERKEAERRILYLAHYDALTGLPNRTLFKDRLGQVLPQAKRHRKIVAAMLIDIDRFKYINDTLGHTIGDLLLQGIAQRLTNSVRKSDSIARHCGDPINPLVSRMGGDEFIISLSELTRIEDAAHIAMRIIESLSEPFMVDGHEIFVTASLGISIFPNDGEEIDTLLKNADIAMYHAKDQGRNNFQFYSASMNSVSLERLTMENKLRKALEREEFVLYYQPQLELSGGKIIGIEALIRWKNPEMGLVPPGQFIHLAEETGLIVPLGEWVLRTACAQNKAWQNAGYPPLRISVNISGRQFRQKDLGDTVSRIVHETGMDPQHIELELTESIIMKNEEETIKTLYALKDLGLNLSIDDFGTGYSSLSYLKRFPIDSLKIDRSFIRDLTTNADDAAITRAIIAMAHSLKLRVVAEGVEEEKQIEFLREEGCDEMQGFFFSPPVPAEAFIGLIQEGKHLQVGMKV